MGKGEVEAVNDLGDSVMTSQAGKGSFQICNNYGFLENDSTCKQHSLRWVFYLQSVLQVYFKVRFFRS